MSRDAVCDDGNYLLYNWRVREVCKISSWERSRAEETLLAARDTHTSLVQP